MFVKRQLLAGFLAVAAVSAYACEIHATTYGSFVISNPSNVAIHYQVRWGNGDWQTVCIYPGEVRWHYYEIDENGQVPTPSVRFDCIAGDEDITYRVYNVDVYQTCYP